MQWKTVTVATGQGMARAVAPEIIAASRATDIPAFYAPWFVKRLRAGHVRWRNPFNGQWQYVSFARARAAVFWSKNPAPLLPYLRHLDALGLAYYLEYTLNDYEAEGWEPGLPSLASRVKTFRRYAQALGPERVVWRFDPLLLAGPLAVAPHACELLLDKVARVGRAIAGCTSKLVFSFADIANYAGARSGLQRAGLHWRDFTPEETATVAAGVARIAADLGVSPRTCGEEMDLAAYGIERNRCIDPELILRLTNRHPDILRLLGLPAQEQTGLPGAQPQTRWPRDTGQRAACLCVPAKDVGQYATCPHGCVYCYANRSPGATARNFQEHDPEGESIARPDCPRPTARRD